MANERAGNLFTSLTVTGIVTLCAAPAITLNVWPRIETILQQGLTSNELGIVMLVGISAIAMTTIPFAMQKSPNRAFWWTSLAFGVGLAVLNYIMAVGAIGKLSDHATEKAAAAISKAASLRSALEDLRAARRELGNFKPTSETQLRAADDAVRLAIEARDQECGKVGDFCRARVAQLQSRLSDRADVAGALSLTARSRGLDARADAVRLELDRIGNVPQYTNPQAERIRTVVAVIYPNAATEAVANGIIHFLAIAAELFALGMPRIMVTALSRPKGAVNGTSVISPQIGGALSPQKLLGSRRHQQKLPPPAITGSLPPTVAAWKREAIRSGTSKLICWNVYQRYVQWCKESGVAAASFTQFDFELCEAGVKKVTEGRGSFYTEIAL